MTRIELVRKLLQDNEHVNEEVRIRIVTRTGEGNVIRAIEYPISYTKEGWGGFAICGEDTQAKEGEV